MRSLREHPRTVGRSRRGVSLIEMLVVMAIIALLAAGVFTVLGKTGEAARIASTRTTITKLDSLLKARYDELIKNFDDQERKKTRADVVGNPQGNWLNILGFVETHGSVSGYPRPLGTAITKADRYRGSFPQREEDMWGLDNSPGGGDDSPLLAVWNSATPVWNNVPRSLSNHNLNAENQKTESSELLYLALTIGASSGAGKNILEDINPRHIRDTDEDGVPEFVDDWGRPLRFYYAPTRLVRPGGPPLSVPTAVQHALTEALMSSVPAVAASATDFTQSFNQDPFDPKGGLRNPSLPTGFEDAYHTINTWYQPLIVSCGPDEQLGLGEPAPPTGSADPLYYRLAYPVTPDEAADNITNLQRVGAN